MAIRSLLHIMSDPEFKPEDVPKFVHLKGFFKNTQFPFFPLEEVKSADGCSIWVNPFQHFITFLLGLPETFKYFLGCHRKNNCAEDILDGSKIQMAQYFWCKCAQLEGSAEFIFLGDFFSVPLQDQFLFQVQEIFEKDEEKFLRCRQLFRVKEIAPNGCYSADERWVISTVEVFFRVKEVGKVCTLSEADIFPRKLERINSGWGFGPLINFQEIEGARQVSGGKPYVTVGVNLFTDEWGGSCRGKFNKFESIYISPSFFPRRLRNIMRYCWHFWSSNVASFSSVFNVVAKNIKCVSTEGLSVFVADLGTDVYVDGDIFSLLADNPRQQDICNVGAVSTQKWCRKCTGDKGVICSCFCSLRQYKDTLNILQTLPPGLSLDKGSGVKLNGVEDLSSHPNLDPHSDTIFEILHTILLGIVKYAVKDTVSQLSVDVKKRFMALLKSENFFGFEGDRLNGNVFANYKSFHGKDFKILVQIMPYLLAQAGADHRLIDGWLIVAELSKYAFKLSFNFRPGCEPHSKQIHTAVQCMVNIFPSMKKKFKVHLISCHMLTDFVILGLLVNGSTERFEAMHKIMRGFYRSSNMKSPGRDIAVMNAQITATLFVLLGGKWRDPGCNVVQQATNAVQDLRNHPAFRNVSCLKVPPEAPFPPRLFTQNKSNLA
eukprot:Pompholyxophrys_punicea_v1_NODE_59_length_4107_cov_22.914878.p1 type:complete len:659 gc:universal NODE_59_length_4107_cov_22.914878:1113-3089(+)